MMGTCFSPREQAEGLSTTTTPTLADMQVSVRVSKRKGYQPGLPHVLLLCHVSVRVSKRKGYQRPHAGPRQQPAGFQSA